MRLYAVCLEWLILTRKGFFIFMLMLKTVTASMMSCVLACVFFNRTAKARLYSQTSQATTDLICCNWLIVQS